MSEHEFPALKEAQGKLDAARRELKGVFDEAGPNRDMALVKSLNGDANAKVDWIRSKNEEITDLKQSVDRLVALERAAESVRDVEPERKGADTGNGDPQAPNIKGLAGQIVKAVNHKHGGASKGATVSLDVETKDLFDRTTGWTPEVVRSGLVTLAPMVPAPSVVDHLVTMPVTQSGYKYMEETTYNSGSSDDTGIATDVASIAQEVSEGATFAEAALGLTERLQSVEKVAVWLPMTDEQLEDEPGARAYAQARLENMLRQRLDKQVLQGDGSSPNLLGTINKAGINTRAVGNDTTLDALYKMFTTIRTVGYAEPNVVFMQAQNWQPVQLLKTADGQYIWGNPQSGGPSVAWGVPIVQTQAAVANTAVTGDYARYAFLGVKRGVDVQLTNAHEDFFINGKQAIRVDTRVVMVHIRPSAFGKVTGLSV